jgi:LDH2 family malate/lactate/ureidoglycolate dehydrogenase
MEELATLSLAEVRDLAFSALASAGASVEHAHAIAEIVTAAEADECRSHGLYRIPGYVAALGSGVAGNASPRVLGSSPGVVRVDAMRGFAPLAVKLGRPILAERARNSGVAALGISNCYHFAALWIDIEPLAELGLVVIACTIGQRRVATHGSARPVLGTNPIAFAWPREGAPPFAFDFATSVVARGEIELHARDDRELPAGWAIDSEGQPTTDAVAALTGALLPFGGHKGAALSMMVELLAGALLAEPADDAAADEIEIGPRSGGELIVAFDPTQFGGSSFLSSAEMFFATLQETGGGRLPSARRYAARERSRREGVQIPCGLLKQVRMLARGAG